MKKINAEDLYLKLLLLFPVFTLFQGIPALNWINRVLFVVTFVLQIYLQFNSLKIKVQWLPFIGLLLLVHFYALTNTKFPMYNTNTLFYFFFWFMVVLYFVDIKDRIGEIIRKNIRYIINIVRVWTVIVAVTAFIPACYKKVKLWGGGTYFVSITGNTFRIAQAALMILTLVLVYFYLIKNRQVIIYTIMPMYCFLMCGSRTYLGVGVLVFIIFWYIYTSNKIVFFISLIPLLFIVGFLISKTAAGDKIAATTYTKDSYFDYWGTISNGRSIFWEVDLKYFFRESFLNQLLGCGFNFDYEVTQQYYTSAHWAHNDLIGALLNFGYVGLVLYVFSIVLLFKTFFTNSSIPIVIRILIVFVWFINAMFNMFYTYTCSVISFLIMLSCISYYYHGRESKSLLIR